MISYEKNIENMYREPVYATGGGTRRTAWDIEWQDEPFAASDTAVVSPLKLPSLMKDIWETGVPTKESAVYIHVPFCETHCLYCGFYNKAYREDESRIYADALIQELRLWRGRPGQDAGPVHAVYMGGGTPTALQADDLRRILKEVRAVLPLANDCASLFGE